LNSFFRVGQDRRLSLQHVCTWSPWLSEREKRGRLRFTGLLPAREVQ